MDKCRHNSLLIWTHSQADKSPVIPSLFLLLPPVSVSSLFLTFPLPSLSTEQGQLKNIPCSILAQTRHSPGPLIKHKPSPSPSFAFSLSLGLFFSLHCHLAPSASHPLVLSSLPFLLPSNLFPSVQWCFPLFTALLALHPLPSLPICHGRGLIFTLGQSSESIWTMCWTCYSLLLVLTMHSVTSAM